MKPGCPGPGENPGLHPAHGSRDFPESLVTPDPGVFPASEPLPAPRDDPVRAARLFNLPSDRSAVAARAGDCFCLGCLCCLCYKDRKRRLLASIVCVLAGAAGWWLAAGLVAGCGVGLWCWLVGLARPGRQPAVRGGRKGMSETGALRFWLGSGWTQARSPSLPGCLV